MWKPKKPKPRKTYTCKACERVYTSYYNYGHLQTRVHLINVVNQERRKLTNSLTDPSKGIITTITSSNVAGEQQTCQLKTSYEYQGYSRHVFPNLLMKK